MLAAFVLVSVMGVTVLSKETTKPAKKTPSPTAYVAPQPAPAPPVVPRRVAAVSPLSAISSELRTIEKNVKSWDLDHRSAAFEEKRVQALSGLSDLRERLDTFLTSNLSDRGDRLWDRLQRVYVMVKKL